MMSKEVGSKISILFSLIQICNLIYFEMGVAGSDFIIIGTTYVIGLRLAILFFQNKNTYYLILSMILLCFFFGSRSIFLFLMPFNIFLFWLCFGKKIIKLFIPIILITYFSYIIPFLINPEMYTPFHLFGKLYSLIFPLKYVFIICIIFIIWLEIKYKIITTNINQNNIFFYQVILIAFPLCLAILLSLLKTKNLATWEELNYALIFLPSVLYFVAINYKKDLRFIS